MHRSAGKPIASVLPMTVLLSVLALPLTAAEPGRPAPIIDMHLHAFSVHDLGDPPPPNPLDGKPTQVRTADELRTATLALLERHNIVKAVVSGSIEAQWSRAAGTRFIRSAMFPPHGTLPDVEDLRKAFEAGELALFGEMALQYRGLAADDPILEPYWALAEELDIPVGVHTGLAGPGTPYTCCPQFRVSGGNPLQLEEVLVKHPKLRLYMMHAGYPYLQETKAIMYMYPQVYADIAVINWTLPRAEFHSYLEALVTAGLGERLMFGSDQMIWPEAITVAVESVESAAFLSEEQKRDIFYDNAVRFLRLAE